MERQKKSYWARISTLVMPLGSVDALFVSLIYNGETLRPDCVQHPVSTVLLT